MSYLMRSLDYIVRLRYWLQRRIILVKKEILCAACCSKPVIHNSVTLVVSIDLSYMEERDSLVSGRPFQRIYEIQKLEKCKNEMPLHIKLNRIEFLNKGKFRKDAFGSNVEKAQETKQKMPLEAIQKFGINVGKTQETNNAVVDHV